MLSNTTKERQSERALSQSVVRPLPKSDFIPYTNALPQNSFAVLYFDNIVCYGCACVALLAD